MPNHFAIIPTPQGRMLKSLSEESFGPDLYEATQALQDNHGYMDAVLFRVSDIYTEPAEKADSIMEQWANKVIPTGFHILHPSTEKLYPVPGLTDI